MRSNAIEVFLALSLAIPVIAYSSKSLNHRLNLGQQLLLQEFSSLLSQSPLGFKQGKGVKPLCGGKAPTSHSSNI
jgi:hypothetical protein